MSQFETFLVKIAIGWRRRGVGGPSPHEYKVCKCPDHIHKKLQPKKISIPIALFRPRQNKNLTLFG